MDTVFVGLDVHKVSISVTTAEDGRDGSVRFCGEVANTPEQVRKLAERLSRSGDRLEFCYEAGGCGYGIYRQLTEMGHGCLVAAPTLIARKPGDRIKTDRRDSQMLALQHRSGGLTAVWVPDEVHEAMRDLVAMGKWVGPRIYAVGCGLRAQRSRFNPAGNPLGGGEGNGPADFARATRQQIAAGADEAIGEEPVDRFAARKSAPAQAAGGADGAMG